jgi:hypothetical protein
MIGEKPHLISLHGGNRYFYAPNFMIGLLLLLNVDLEAITRTVRSKVCAGFLTLVLIMGAYRYWTPPDFFTRWDVAWRQEVLLWRQNPEYELRIWPEGWTVRLDPWPRDSSR